MRFSASARPFALLRALGVVALVLVSLFVSSGLPLPLFAAGQDIVFVARSHLASQDIFFQEETGPAGQFGTGLDKFAPKSKLMIRHGDGSVTTLVNGASPSAATGYLIDVMSPDVSFDGTKIVFAGATTMDPEAAQYGWRLYEIGVDGQGFRKLPIPDRTFTSVPNNNSKGFDYWNYDTYHWWNDLFPAYLADGRIVFASSRYPSRSHYDSRPDYNLYIVNDDGSDLHRITTERGGLLHPTPLPDGRILFSRWWLNFNQPSSQGVFNRIDNRDSSYTLPDGTLINGNPDAEFNPPTGKLPDGGSDIRQAPNGWHLHVVNPDGTDFARMAFTPWAKWSRTEDSGSDTYTAAQPAVVFSNGEMFIAYTTQPDGSMVHSTQSSGIRVARAGVEMLYANSSDSIAGLGYHKAWEQGDYSLPFALHPAGMPDGKILFSYASTTDGSLPTSGTYNDPVTGRQFILQGSNTQYKLNTMDINGNGKTILATNIGTADAMDAKPIAPRTGWASKGDDFTTNSDDDPRQWNVPSDLFPQAYGWSQKNSGNIQMATLHNPNVYANPPLSIPYINNSPPPGSVAKAEIWLDANQFTGAACYDYPGNPEPCTYFKQDVQNRAIKYTSVPVSARGEFTVQVPADVPAFIVLRDANGRAVSGCNRGYISIAQGNAYARPGQTVTCVGCHFGHVSGSITNIAEAEAGWTNVAPYASVTASSETESDNSDHPFSPQHINDRRGFIPIPAGGPPNPEETDDAQYQDTEYGWISDRHENDSDANGEWAQLTWSSPVKIKSVRLIGPPSVGGEWGSFGSGPNTTPYHITSGTLVLSSNGQVVKSVDVGQVNSFSEGGTQVNLDQPTVIDNLRFTIKSTAGFWNWSKVAALNEIEVMGMDDNASPDGSFPTSTPTATRTSTPTSTPPSASPTPTATGSPDSCSGVKPAAPELVSPAPNMKVKKLSVPLDWNAVECATKYKIVVRIGSPDGEIVLKKALKLTGFLTAQLTPAKSYYWQIKACNGKLCTGSDPWKFKVKKNAK